MSTTPGRLRASDRSTDLDEDTQNRATQSGRPRSLQTTENGLNQRIRYERGKIHPKPSNSSMPDNWEKIPGTMKLLYGGTNWGEAYTLIPFHFKSNTLDIANK